jgi:hypothetical protein
MVDFLQKGRSSKGKSRQVRVDDRHLIALLHEGTLHVRQDSWQWSVRAIQSIICAPLHIERIADLTLAIIAVTAMNGWNLLSLHFGKCRASRQEIF